MYCVKMQIYLDNLVPIFAILLVLANFYQNTNNTIALLHSEVETIVWYLCENICELKNQI